ncbi:MAG: hypothetical protein IPK26_20405 [Planctomycetes bacterium]|nr:hypothetical protein [Planctomycetota bacterium]
MTIDTLIADPKSTAPVTVVQPEERANPNPNPAPPSIAEFVPAVHTVEDTELRTPGGE